VTKKDGRSSNGRDLSGGKNLSSVLYLPEMKEIDIYVYCLFHRRKEGVGVSKENARKAISGTYFNCTEF